MRRGCADTPLSTSTPETACILTSSAVSGTAIVTPCRTASSFAPFFVPTAMRSARVPSSTASGAATAEPSCAALGGRALEAVAASAAMLEDALTLE